MVPTKSLDVNELLLKKWAIWMLGPYMLQAILNLIMHPYFKTKLLYMVTVLLLSYLITAYCVQSAPSNKQWQPTNCKVHWAEAVSYHLENDLYPITIYHFLKFIYYYFYCRRSWCCTESFLFYMSFHFNWWHTILRKEPKELWIYISVLFLEQRFSSSPTGNGWMFSAPR